MTGLDIEKKAEIFVTALFDLLGGKDQFDEVTINLHRTDKPDPKTHEDLMINSKLYKNFYEKQIQK